MQINFSDILPEIDSLGNSLSENLGNFTSFMSNSSTPLQHFETVIESIKTDRLLIAAQNALEKQSGFNIGAITSTLYSSAAVLRDYAVASQTKANLYQNADIISSQIINSIEDEVGLTVNRVKVMTPDQGTTV